MRDDERWHDIKSAVEAAIEAAIPLPRLKERRRYAVLQAAAVIYAGGQNWSIERQYMINGHNEQSAVAEAERLLNEIERRECAKVAEEKI